MRLRIEHTTTFTYDVPISEAYSELRLRPLDTDGQRCVSFGISTSPGDQHVVQYQDRFGNDVRYLDVIQPHDRLVVTAASEVITEERFYDRSTRLSPLEEYDFLAPTAYAPVDDRVYEFGLPHIDAGNPWTTALNLMRATRAAMTYEPGATDVQTTADAALALGRGVCQDFAHVMLAACRCHGLAARYVSGYLFSPRFNDFPDDPLAATHAWVDVLIPGHGWISLDPTHGAEQTDHYVRVALGRDYSDVPPTKGMFKGNAKETLDAKVSVRAV